MDLLGPLLGGNFSFTPNHFSNSFFCLLEYHMGVYIFSTKSPLYEEKTKPNQTKKKKKLYYLGVYVTNETFCYIHAIFLYNVHFAGLISGDVCFILQDIHGLARANNVVCFLLYALLIVELFLVSNVNVRVGAWEQNSDTTKTPFIFVFYHFVLVRLFPLLLCLLSCLFFPW